MAMLASFVAAALLGGCSAKRSDQVPPPGPEQLTPVLAAVLAVPQPVMQTGGTWTLAYEIEVANVTNVPMTIAQVDVRDSARDEVVATLAGDVISENLLRPGGAKTATLDAGQAGVLLVNLSFAHRDEVPAQLDHHLVVTKTEPSANLPALIAAQVAPTAIDASDVRVIAPPLRGRRWVAAASCCDSYHRRAVLPVNGRRAVAQRFAIDWMQLDAQGRMASGDPARNESYPQYGAEVFAVAAGTVVHVVDGMPDGTPGSFPAAVTLQTADGNSVIMDLGDGVFALYAHLQPGSIRVRRGDRVDRGQVLGLLGNSGNSDAPHLHFHLMDAPSALGANGVPYVLDIFAVSGEAVSEDSLETELRQANHPVPLRPLPDPAQRTEQLPANLTVVDFAD
jgi:hypothetical protein